MDTFSRRDFHQQAWGSLLAYSLLQLLYQRDAFGSEVKPLAAAWLTQLNDMGNAMKEQRLSQVDWQQQIDSLLKTIDLPDLLKFIDFEKLTRNLQLKDEGELGLRPSFPQVSGFPDKLSYGHQVFALKNGRSVAPHGHNNMATLFIVLKGAFHGRHYQRLEDDRRTMIIEPTIDGTFKAGDHSTVTDYRDNVHWFKATSDEAYIFNIHVQELQDFPDRTNGRIYIDPNGEKLSNNRIRARKVTPAEAYRLYG